MLRDVRADGLSAFLERLSGLARLDVHRAFRDRAHLVVPRGAGATGRGGFLRSRGLLRHRLRDRGLLGSRAFGGAGFSSRRGHRERSAWSLRSGVRGATTNALLRSTHAPNPRKFLQHFFDRRAKQPPAT